MSQSPNNRHLSPRQKMINLMYIILIAMLAINVSSDVLDGFRQVEKGLYDTNENTGNRNAAIFNAIERANEKNPAKVRQWFDKAQLVRHLTDSLFNLINDFKLQIAVEADGADADIENLQNRENLDVAAAVMLNPVTKQGASLRHAIDDYRSLIVSLMPDKDQCAVVEKVLSTQPYKKGGVIEQLWEESKFENQPVIAAMTLLTKLQNDLLYSEGEALASFLQNIDVNDVRVNELNAFVIPESRYVMRGGRYSANIVLAAVDTTARPDIYINGNKFDMSDGIYEFTPNATGHFSYSGYIELTHSDGHVTRHPFESEYEVVNPTATVSATMMNVLYAGIDNPISISVPGVASSAVSASINNGTLTKNGDGGWVARPSKVGSDADITVSASISGKIQPVNTVSFRVRKLPDPTPYIIYSDENGEKQRYKGSVPIAKRVLLSTKSIGAAIDDELLDVPFTVIGFETLSFDSMGNAIPEVSKGSEFSSRQMDMIKRIKRGGRFYISRVRAIGPDGIERLLSPIEVIVN